MPWQLGSRQASGSVKQSSGVCHHRCSAAVETDRAVSSSNDDDDDVDDGCNHRAISVKQLEPSRGGGGGA